MKEYLVVENEIINRTKYIYFDGILDFSTINSLHEDDYEINESFDMLILDISKLDFIDSTGVGLFINLIHESKDNAVQLNINGATEQVEEILETLGVYQVLAAI
ncbi:STAS domain-containing protein [Gracilibacillus massiliensis]|uniref:STAS domain-containing protein n=1 Tax=Gracilibacillus massiliensis TaxID=1564956 RepID=UPI00071DD811|nr:STAS domain-containing protein [Gracilibacillus massiliensis]